MTIEFYLLNEDGATPIKWRPGDEVQVKVSCQGDIAVQPFYPDENTHGIAWLLLCQGPVGEPGRDINGEVDEGDRMLQTQPGVLIGAEDPRSLDVIIEALTELRGKLWLAKAKDIEERLQAGDLTTAEANRLLAEWWGVKPEDCYPSEPEPAGDFKMFGGMATRTDKAIIAELRRAGDQMVKDIRAEGNAYLEAIKETIVVTHNPGGPSIVEGIEFTSLDTYQVKGRGTIKTIQWPEHRGALDILDRVITIDGAQYLVSSIEGASPIKPGATVGLVVIPYGTRPEPKRGGIPGAPQRPPGIPWGKVTQ